MNEEVEHLIPLVSNMRIYCPHCKAMEHLYVSQKMLAAGTIMECKNCKEHYELRFSRHVKPLTVFDVNFPLKKEEK